MLAEAVLPTGPSLFVRICTRCGGTGSGNLDLKGPSHLFSWYCWKRWFSQILTTKKSLSTTLFVTINHQPHHQPHHEASVKHHLIIIEHHQTSFQHQFHGPDLPFWITGSPLATFSWALWPSPQRRFWGSWCRGWDHVVAVSTNVGCRIGWPTVWWIPQWCCGGSIMIFSTSDTMVIWTKPTSQIALM